MCDITIFSRSFMNRIFNEKRRKSKVKYDESEAKKYDQKSTDEMNVKEKQKIEKFIVKSVRKITERESYVISDCKSLQVSILCSLMIVPTVY